jgi:transcription-repair coupling factor (superfamily II helicase)
VREGDDVDLLREEMRDRYGEPPAPVSRLLAVARFRGRCRRAKVGEVTVQGKYIRFAPVDLPESRVVRLHRVHPGSLVKAGVRTMLVPRPQPATFGAAPLRDDELLAWAGRVVDDVIDPPADVPREKQEIRS